jgi:hypothetical protein
MSFMATTSIVGGLKAIEIDFDHSSKTIYGNFVFNIFFNRLFV